MSYKEYEMVIGLEVHVELNTESKIFCGCSTKFGSEANTQCCPTCLGLPGALPELNKKAVEYGIKAGLATNCSIASYLKMDRKHYFYPDLPKAYQTTQYDIPLCSKGYIEIDCEAGKKTIGITRIHLEEDAGKLIHTDGGETAIDYNRCGVPLIEIVSEPDIRSVEEAVAYLQKLRTLIMYAGVSDCKMNQGAFRCDVNLSVRKIGDRTFGVRTEMKNLNSFRFVSNAIEYEFKRQVEELEKGNAIRQETRKYDQVSKKTIPMRVKEDTRGYRYIQEPDLPPVSLAKEYIQQVALSMPMLVDGRYELYRTQYGLSDYDAKQLINIKEIACFFEETLGYTKHAKIVTNLILTELLRLITLDNIQIPISPNYMASLAELIHNEIINSNSAKKIFEEMWKSNENPEIIVENLNIRQINDLNEIDQLVLRVLEENKNVLEDYLSGKKNAMQSLMGQAMKCSKGKANPRILQQRLEAQIRSLS